jgi:hypothetical protein
MLDWHKALAAIRFQQRRHRLKQERRNKKGFEAQDVYHYVYARHNLDLDTKIKEIRHILKTLEKIDEIRHRKVTPRNKLAGRNRFHGI